MSNHRVIAAVTAALKQVLQTVAASVVGGVDIRLGPPTAKIGEETTPRINLFLFRISPNAAQRNARLPVRGSDGSRRRRAEAAVDLHYILSFYGDASAFVPEKLLGATTVALEEVPALFASAIASAVATVEPPVADPSVAAALARVRITPETLTLEEFSKIWSIFFQVPYALSAVYMCSHVVLESQEAYGEAIPIVLRDFLAGPVPGFSLLRAAADEAGTGPVLWGGPLHLAGKGLGKIGTGLSIDGTVMALEPDALSNGAIDIMLQSPPLDELAAGIHIVQAIAPKPTPATPENLRRRTNAVSFALHPTITPGAVAVDNPPADPRSGTITVAFSPAVHEGQAVTLTLDARNAEGLPKTVLDPAPIDPNNPPAFPLGEIVFPFDALPAGDYLVRAHIDGIASLPDVETDPNSADFGLISGPLATVP
jgi:Pvc16 N-terminal domain